MPTNVATYAQFQFLLGTAASPEVLTALEGVTDIAPIGREASLQDVTNFDTAIGARDYIGGRADGQEFTVECNYYANATMQLAAMAAADSAVTRKARLLYTGSSPQRQTNFSVVCKGYTFSPSVNEANKVTFLYKITGSLVRT